MSKTKRKSSTRIPYVSNDPRHSQIFHYTKGHKIPQILRDGVLLSEKKSKVLPKGTESCWTYPENQFDFVWLTSEKRCPWVAYPSYYDSVLNVSKNFKKKRGIEDLIQVLCVGLWRIGFPKSDPRLSRWLSTPEYQRRRTGKVLEDWQGSSGVLGIQSEQPR